ncbi:hypothetical protein [Labrys monachus]|uniref:Uncharacterized protein n=1 Tax=Labrys monachus TaxID=217067 RepID=A0ABU0FBH3_9HYPH|nr:hypothetical protein [Labrys monachus]MDQ0391786.1 hypothetical protein [Labrys monachus]
MPFNQYGFQEVEYGFHFRQYATPFLVEGNVENNRYFTHEAQQNHVFSINNALFELVSDALSILSIVSFSKDSGYYFKYGVMRRLRMIDSSFRSFQSVITPDRTRPLSSEESSSVCRDLNSIYIDILGLLDNYAWTMVWQIGSAATRSADPFAIGLFKPIFAADAALGPMADILQPFREWERDVKTRRNPAAHRMPLYVPPTALTPGDVAEFERLETLTSAALRAQEFEKLDGLREAKQRLGVLVPRFLHHPEGPVVDIFPTLPEDIGLAVKIGRIAQIFLREQG